jgi:hypothetical protein
MLVYYRQKYPYIGPEAHHWSQCLPSVYPSENDSEFKVSSRAPRKYVLCSVDVSSGTTSGVDEYALKEYADTSVSLTTAQERASRRSFSVVLGLTA